MPASRPPIRPFALAERIREACIAAALAAYEDAAVRGLCHEGAWEAAVGAMRALDLTAVVPAPDRSGDQRSRGSRRRVRRPRSD